MSGMKSYKELDAWQLAMTLVEAVYDVSRRFPDVERYGLSSQMRRCAISIPSNIAEGQARGTARYGLHFIRIAIGSIEELDTQVELARRLRFASTTATHDLDAQLDRVRQMLYGMRREHHRRIIAAGTAIASVLFFLRVFGLFA